jgi:hypothetical protein
MNAMHLGLKRSKVCRMKLQGYRVWKIAEDLNLSISEVIEHLHEGGLIRIEMIEAKEYQALRRKY